jgi:hypothetical protein
MRPAATSAASEWRTLSYRYGSEGRSGPARDDGQGIWRRRSPKALQRGVVWTVPGKPSPAFAGLRLEHGSRRRGLSWRRSAERAVRQLLQQMACDHEAECGNRVRIMPLWTDAATLAAGSPGAAPGLITQHGRGGLRGGNGSAH